MSLFFGENIILNNQVIPPSETKLEISYDFQEIKHIHTLILYNSTTNYVFWFNVDEIDILPYRLPENPGRYVFLILDLT